MRLEPPQPPTAPAPSVRPTPPKPPRIDKTPFAKESADVDKPAQESADEPATDKPAADAPQLQREVETPETMARDAVAHGSGALTKRTVDKPQAEPAPAPRQETAPVDTQSDYDRGQDVLREFKALDTRDAQPTENFPAHSAHTSTEPTKPAVPKLRYDEGHGMFYWLFTIVFVAIAAFVVARKFLFTGKATITSSELFDKPARQTATQSPAPAKKSTPVPRAEKPKKDADKGKHFEVRV